MEKKVDDFFLLFPNKSKFLLALSGGADSVALFRALISAGIDFNAVHCNFHLRAEESNRDMQFVEDLCSNYEINLHIEHFDVETYRRNTKTSVEMACRELRYELFRKLRTENDYTRILTAHHADDNIETMMLNMLRGSGISGLRAMLPDNGETARPLLTVTKSEITDYLRSINQDYVVDSTNLSSDYKRNFIRNEILPRLEAEWPGLRPAITRSLAILRSEDAFLNKTLSRYSSLKTIPYDIISDFDSASLILHSYMKPIAISSKTLGDIIRTVTSGTPQPGKKWIGKAGMAYTTSAGIEYRMNSDMQEIEIAPGKLPPGYRCDVFANNAETFREATTCHDDKILYIPEPPECITFRHIRKGDRIRPIGMKGSQLVSRVFKNAGINIARKRDIWIAENSATGEIIWVEGLKRSSQMLITRDTQTIYRISRCSDV